MVYVYLAVPPDTFSRWLRDCLRLKEVKLCTIFPRKEVQNMKTNVCITAALLIS